MQQKRRTLDDKSPFVTSGIRLGSPALTTRGLKEEEFRRVGSLILEVINNINNDDAIKKVRAGVDEICRSFPTDFLRI